MKNKLKKIPTSFINLLDLIGNAVLTAGSWFLAAALPWLWQAIITVLDWIGLLAIKTVGSIIKLLEKTKLGQTKWGKGLGSVWQKRHRQHRPVLWGAVFVLIIFLPLAILRLKTPTETEAGWWNEGWLYRKRVPISNSGSAQTDFQINLTLDTASLIAEGKMQDDCDDIRLTDQNGKILPHWIEENNPGCNDAATTIWAKVPTIPDSNSNLYIYYGNSSSTNAESGEETFEFFDDFSNNSLDTTKWHPYSNASSNYSFSNGVMQIWGSDYTPIYSKESFSNEGLIVRSRIKRIVDSDFDSGIWFSYNGGTGTGMGSGIGNFVDDDANGHHAGIIYPNWATLPVSYTGSIGVDSWETLEIWRDGTTVFASAFGEEISTTIDAQYTNPIGLFSDSDSSGRPAHYEYILIRKYAATPPSASSPASEEVSPGPLAYWKFDEGYGSTAHDSTGHNLNGTIQTSTWKDESMCISGKCIYFDGDDEAVYVDNNTLLHPDNFSISMWIKPNQYSDNTNVGYILADNYGATEDFIFYLHSTGKLGLRPHLGTDRKGETTIPLNEWTHVAATYDGSTISLYVNGQYDGGGSSSGMVHSTSQFRIGGHNAVGWESSRYNGFIDEVKIYPYARSVDQIKADYSTRGGNQGTAATFGDNQQQNFLSEGLIGYWKMEETSSPSLDSSGNDNSAIWSGSSTSTMGKFSNSIDFEKDNTTDYLSISDTPTLSPSTITVSTWIKPESISSEYDPVISKGNTFSMRTQGGIFEFIVNNGAWIQNTGFTYTDIPTEKWSHVVGSYDGQNVKIYLNGVLKDTTTTSGNLLDSANAIEIGRGLVSDRLFDGSIDEVRIYNRALSPREVQQLYNWAPGPIAYWNFDEKSGTTLNDRARNLYSGSLQNSPVWINGKFGGALEFDGSYKYVNISDIPALPEFSLSAWVYNVSGGDSRHSILRNYWEIVGNQVCFWSYDFTDTYWRCSGSDVPYDAWTHIETTWDGSIIRHYINGVLAWEDSSSSSGTSQNFTSIAGYSGRNFKGKLDEFKVYNYARTPGQIIEDMNAGHPLGGSPLSSKVGYWKFDEGYGSTANDDSQQGNSGTITGSWSNTCKFGKCLSFDGVGDHVSVTDSTSLDSIVNAFTVSAWVYDNDVDDNIDDNRNIADKGDVGGTVNNTFRLRMEENKRVSLRINDGTSGNNVTSSTAIPYQTWTHVAGTFDGTQIRIYINGVEDATPVNKTIGDLVDSGNFVIGRQSSADCGSPYNSCWKGMLDEVKLYSTALTEDQIKLDMNQGASSVMGAVGTDSSGNASFSSDRSYCLPGDTTASCAPIAQWNFDEKQGTSTQDISGNNNAAALTNMDNSNWRSAAQCRVGACLDFSGDNQYLTVTDDGDSSLDLGSTVTFEVWAKSNRQYPSDDANINYRGFIDKNTGGGSTSINYNFHWHGDNDTSSLRFCLGDGATADCDVIDIGPLTVGRWYHFAASWDGSTIDWYVDGVYQGSSSNTTLPKTDNTSVYIGGHTFGSTGSTMMWDGSLDQLTVYDYARTPAQIAYSYNRGKPVAHWKLDSCQGTTAYDSSGNENHGTITIGPSGTNTSAGTCTGSSGEAWGDGADGKRNASLEFDGTDDWLDGISQPAVSTSPNLFTIAGWMKPNAQDSRFVTPNSYGIDQYLSYDSTNQRLSITVAEAADTNQRTRYSSINSVPTGAWTHWAVSLDDKKIKIYINGQLDAEYDETIDIAGWEGNWRIGQRGNSTYWYSGQLDEIQVFSYALTDQQVKNVHNKAAIRFGPN